MTQKQNYANIANRRVNNHSVCITEEEKTIETPPSSIVPPVIDTTNQDYVATLYGDNTHFDNSNLYNKSELASDLIEDLFLEFTGISQIILATDSYPSCSYKPIKF